MSKQEYIATLSSKEIYKATYRDYRNLSTAIDSTTKWWLRDNLALLHKSFPKIAAAAHTSFSMRDLYHS